MPPHTYDFVARTFNMSQMNNFQCNITNVISTRINTRLDPTFIRTSTFYIRRSKISVTLVQETSEINKSFCPVFQMACDFSMHNIQRSGHSWMNSMYTSSKLLYHTSLAESCFAPPLPLLAYLEQYRHQEHFMTIIITCIVLGTVVSRPQKEHGFPYRLNLPFLEYSSLHI